MASPTNEGLAFSIELSVVEMNRKLRAAAAAGLRVEVDVESSPMLFVHGKAASPLGPPVLAVRVYEEVKPVDDSPDDRQCGRCGHDWEIHAPHENNPDLRGHCVAEGCEGVCLSFVDAVDGVVDLGPCRSCEHPLHDHGINDRACHCGCPRFDAR